MNEPISPVIKWIALAGPVIILIAQAIAELTLSTSVLSVLHSENGPHETLQAVLTAGGFCAALWTLVQMKGQGKISIMPWIAAYMALAALCCFYVAGEEISWGQHIFDWTTPGYWDGLNDQGETNLHNVSSLFDQKPRLVLFIGIVIGGLVIPSLQALKPDVLNRAALKRFHMLYPHPVLALIAFATVLIVVLDKIDDSNDSVVIFERASEIQESFMFFFVLLYILILRQKILR